MSKEDISGLIGLTILSACIVLIADVALITFGIAGPIGLLALIVAFLWWWIKNWVPKA